MVLRGGKHEGETQKKGSGQKKGLWRTIKGTHAEEENKRSKENKRCK